MSARSTLILLPILLVACTAPKQEPPIREQTLMNAQSLDKLPDKITDKLKAARHRLEDVHTRRNEPLRNNLNMSFTLDAKPVLIGVTTYDSPEVAHEKYEFALQLAPLKTSLSRIGDEAFMVTVPQQSTLHVRTANTLIGIMADSEELCRKLARDVIQELHED